MLTVGHPLLFSKWHRSHSLPCALWNSGSWRRRAASRICPALRCALILAAFASSWAMNCRASASCSAFALCPVRAPVQKEQQQSGLEVHCIVAAPFAWVSFVQRSDETLDASGLLPLRILVVSGDLALGCASCPHTRESTAQTSVPALQRSPHPLRHPG